MILGIVGSEGAKFTAETEGNAKETIRGIIDYYRPTHIVSGKCHLGGIDLWAEEASKFFGLVFLGFPPKSRKWEGGYKDRNIQIAEHADRVVCLTVKDLPAGFKEGGWERYCYHCGTKDHIKSGGCWTVKYAKKIGKQGEVIVI